MAWARCTWFEATIVESDIMGLSVSCHQSRPIRVSFQMTSGDKIPPHPTPSLSLVHWHCSHLEKQSQRDREKGQQTEMASKVRRCAYKMQTFTWPAHRCNGFRAVETMSLKGWPKQTLIVFKRITNISHPVAVCPIFSILFFPLSLLLSVNCRTLFSLFYVHSLRDGFPT